MCGICGIVSASGPADSERLARMSSKLVHRGPDSHGTYVDGPVALAARRLAIIDLATGDQPIANEDETVHVVQNGEDRKSTRLNSSHTVISYAVFCLKKKKK